MCKYKPKNYLHFDKKINMNEKNQNYVETPSNIASHSFFPLVHYTIIQNRFDSVAKKRSKPKYREIMYASHIDSYIYHHYAQLLNNQYNIFAETTGIDGVVVAYRNNKSGKSNIDFAAEVISFINNRDEGFIMVGDFEKYFDSLNHRLLKEATKTVLNEIELPDDWYKVLKSITKYNYIDKKDIVTEVGSEKELKDNGKSSFFESPNEFRAFKEKYEPIPNQNCFGIPQGTPISAVFANIYLHEADIALNELAVKHSGLYRRYSDDIILFIPKSSKCNTVDDFKNIVTDIEEIISKSKVNLQSEKTKLYQFSNKNIQLINTEYSNNNSKDFVDYLGFIFDGENIYMRQKSVTKFYRKAKKHIKKSINAAKRKGLPKMIRRRHLYKYYSDRQPIISKNSKKIDYGNFINYAKRAQRKFDEISPNTNNLMMQQIKNRKVKLLHNVSVKKEQTTDD